MKSLNRILVFLALAILTAMNSANAQSFLSVYRNDKNFNFCKLTDNYIISHKIEEGIPSSCFTDWWKGVVSVPVSAIDSCVIRDKDIPTLRFELPDYPLHPVLWDKELYVNTRFNIEGNGYCEDATGLTPKIKGRGNTTWAFPKKPMRIKFDKKTSICGFKKSKNYVLLANYIDPSLMRNSIAMWVAKRLGIPYPNTIVPCNVFLNNVFLGSYNLTEKVGINSSSVDIDENTGILFEIDLQYDEIYKFLSKQFQSPVMVKDPDFDELYEADQSITPAARLEKWEADYNKAESSILEGNGSEYFDYESAVNFILLNEIISNYDMRYPKSLFIFKKSLEEKEKYIFGPAWDFDLSYNWARSTDKDNEYIPASNENWMTKCKLLENIAKDPKFQVLFKQKFKEFYSNDFDDMLKYFDEYAKEIEPSAKLNGVRWPDTYKFSPWCFIVSSFDTKQNIADLRNWIIGRVEWMKKNIDNYPDNPK